MKVSKYIAFFIMMIAVALAGCNAKSANTYAETHSPKEAYLASGSDTPYSDILYEESDGYALVSGQKRHYWLYDTYSWFKGDGGRILQRFIPAWVEEMGYAIDFENIKEISPDSNMPESVKGLMAQRGKDVAVTLVTNKTPNYIEINCYDKDDDVYWTMIYYLYK